MAAFAKATAPKKAELRFAVVLLAAWSNAAPAQRLSPTTIPEHYDIHLPPDFATDTFAGQVGVSVRLSEPSRSITLHAAEIDFHEVTIGAGGTTQVASVTLDAASETATLTVPQTI